MSDHSSKRHIRNNEVFEVANLYQLQWVAHWTRASSSSTSSQSHQRFAVQNAMKNQLRGKNYSPIEKFTSYDRRNHFTSYDSENSRRSNSDWEHSPMFKINRKIETTMASKKRTSSSTIAARKNEPALCLQELQWTPRLIEFSSEEHQHEQEEERRAINYGEIIPYDLNEDENGDLESKQQFSNELCKLNKMSNGSSARTRLALTPSGSKKEDNVSGNSTVPENLRGAAFFEKLTLPSMLYHHSSMNNMVGADEIDPQSIEKQKEPLVETDMLIDVCEIPRSPEVGNSPTAKTISQSVVLTDLKSSKTADKDTDTPETHRMEVQPFDPPRRSTQLDSELSSKWVKRFHPDPLDAIPLGAKRLKMEDVSSSGEMQNLLTRVVNYNRSISDLPEINQLGSTSHSAKVIPWIRRWCRSSQESEPETQSAVLREPENSRLIPKKFEAKQFPSLAAMALVGKQVTNFQPCEFQKRGSTVVWNA